MPKGANWMTQRTICETTSARSLKTSMVRSEASSFRAKPRMMAQNRMPM